MVKKITSAQFEIWLTNFKNAWENLDPLLLSSLFTEDIFYFETPFELPITSLEALEQYWASAANFQTRVTFMFEIIGTKGMRGFAKWKAAYTNFLTDEYVTLDGIFEVKFGKDGKCVVFREWWHKNIEYNNVEAS